MFSLQVFALLLQVFSTVSSGGFSVPSLSEVDGVASDGGSGCLALYQASSNLSYASDSGL